MKDYKSGFLSDQQNYEELSQLLKKSYSSQSDISLYVEIDEITQWLKQDISKPLLITSPEFGGTKTLLCQLLRHCSQSNPNYLTISQFASVSPYYSQLLYKITTQLRSQLDINQKVQLNEEKLRQYFSYWLQVADQKIQRDYLGYTKDQKLKVIIVIEGVDKVVDGKGNSVRPSFWLPHVNLKNIRIIYTVQTGSSAIECLQPTISYKIQYILSDSKISSIKQKLIKQNPKLQKFSQSTHFGDLKIASKILSTHPKLNIDQKNISFDQFLLKFVNYLSNYVESPENICRMLACLVWSKKGISKNTLRRSFKFSPEAVDKFLTSVKDIIITSGGDAYLIINRKLKQYIVRIIDSKLGNQDNIRREVHTLLAKALKKQTYTLNVLEELIYHQICSFNFTQLKELLSRIENFLVLYTPLTKHLLCMCWFQLEIQFQYDPVFQYNKAIERFLNHYYPSPQDTFKIIFQLSLFFKQYSEFENSKTPDFRHPPIRGEIDQLKQISIFDELMHMNMYQKTKIKNKQTLKQTLKGKKQIRQKDKQKDKDKEKQKEKQKQKLKQKQPTQSRLSITVGSEQKQLGEQGQIKQVQKLNVRIKFHQQKFKNLYLRQMQPYLSEFYIIKKKSLMNKKDQLLDEDSDDSENQMDQTKIDVERMKKGLMLKKFSDYCEQEYHRSSEKRSFYYYKQWIWMQFPWICQSLNHHYSELIQKCMKSPTQYMSIQTQSKLISQAIKIAKIAKQNKRQIYDINTKMVNQSKQLALRAPNHQSMLQKTRSIVKYKPGSSKYKQKFDVSLLDSELQRSMKPKPQLKNQSSIFMTDLTVNQSYMQQKQNTQTLKTSRLPNIMKCSKIISSRIQKNIDIVDTRQYKLLVSRYDELKHENEQLMQKIQAIQYNRQTLKLNNKENLREVMKLQIEQIKERKVKIMKNYKIQEALRSKLQMILKLCDYNKSHGSESADLHNFLNSLKTMCKIQEQNLQAANQEAKKILEDHKSSYRQLKQDKNNLILKLKKQKNRLTKSNTGAHTCKDIEKLPCKSKYTNGKKKKPQISKQDTKRKNRFDKEMQQISGQLNILCENLGFVSGDTQKNEQIFQKFEQKMDKLNQIQWKLSQLIDQNNLKQKQLHQIQQQVKVSKGHREHQKQVKQRNLSSLICQQTQKTQQRIRCLQKCFALLQQSKAQHIEVLSPK